MNTCTIYLGYALTIGVAEAVIFLLAAVLLGFSIHFYWFGKRSVPGIQKVFPLDSTSISEDDQWRLQFYEQLEQHEKNEERLQKELLRMAEAEKVLIAELEEARDELIRLEKVAEKRVVLAPEGQQQDVQVPGRHYSDLLIAQQNFNDYLTKELAERLEKAYQEFNFLQERIDKMHEQAVEPSRRTFQFDELQQAYLTLSSEYEELKLKYLNLMEDNQKLTRVVSDAEEKLRETNFQNQQSSKKLRFLEEMVGDLQEISGHNKKLEIQLKRISEIESMLNKAAGEIRKA